MTTSANSTPLQPALSQASPGTSMGGRCALEAKQAELALTNFLTKLLPIQPGWYAMLYTVPGLNWAEWHLPVNLGIIESVVQRGLSLHGHAQGFLFENGQLALVIKEPDAKLLPDLEAALVKTLQQTPGVPHILHFNLATQAQELIAYATEKHNFNVAQKQQAEKQQALQRAHALQFKLTPDDLTIRTSRKKPVILLVEDDPSTGMLIASLIKRDATILTAMTSAEAVELYKQNVPDMVFLDIGLPDVDGLTLLSHISRADPGAHVIMLTGNAYMANLEKARRGGAKGFVAKPFTLSKIEAALDHAFIKA